MMELEKMKRFVACLEARLAMCEGCICDLYEELRKGNKKRRRRFIK